MTKPLLTKDEQITFIKSLSVPDLVKLRNSLYEWLPVDKEWFDVVDKELKERHEKRIQRNSRKA